MQNFIDTILKNLESNGFPAKKVSLPTEKMYEVADQKGFSLNKVLDVMREENHINIVIEDEKIIFSKTVISAEGFPNLNPDMMKKAQEMMSGIDPEELKKIQDQIESMSEEEKAEMMAKAKSMGLY
jgi:hypothetical protein